MNEQLTIIDEDKSTFTPIRRLIESWSQYLKTDYSEDTWLTYTENMRQFLIWLGGDETDLITLSLRVR